MMVLSQCLQQLYECGELKAIALKIKGYAEVLESVSDDLCIDEARELRSWNPDLQLCRVAAMTTALTMPLPKDKHIVGILEFISFCRSTSPSWVVGWE